MFPILEDSYRNSILQPSLYKYNIIEVYESSTTFTINKKIVFVIAFVLKLNNLESNNVKGIHNYYVLRYFINNSNEYEKVSVDKFKIFLYSYYEFKCFWIESELKEVWNGFNALFYIIQLCLFSSQYI